MAVLLPKVVVIGLFPDQVKSLARALVGHAVVVGVKKDNRSLPSGDYDLVVMSRWADARYIRKVSEAVPKGRLMFSGKQTGTSGIGNLVLDRFYPGRRLGKTKMKPTTRSEPLASRLVQGVAAIPSAAARAFVKQVEIQVEPPPPVEVPPPPSPVGLSLPMDRPSAAPPDLLVRPLPDSSRPWWDPINMTAWRRQTGIKVLVTKEMAAAWLTLNTRNIRPISGSLVEKYKRDMENNAWTLAVECIAFGEDGKLANGQHRLTAATLAEKPFLSLVLYGCTDEEIRNFDMGQRRAEAHVVARLEPEVDAAKVTPVAKLLLRELLSATPTTSEVVKFVNRHAEPLKFAARHLHGNPALHRSVIRSVITRAWYHVKLAELEVFCHVLLSGIVSEERDETILPFRDLLLSSSGTRGRKKVADNKGMRDRAEWVLRKWLDRAPLPKRHFNTVVELFPLPEEVEAAEARAKAEKAESV